MCVLVVEKLTFQRISLLISVKALLSKEHNLRPPVSILSLDYVCLHFFSCWNCFALFLCVGAVHDSGLFVFQLCVTVFLGLIVGAIFFGVTDDASGLQNRWVGGEGYVMIEWLFPEETWLIFEAEKTVLLYTCAPEKMAISHYLRQYHNS